MNFPEWLLPYVYSAGRSRLHLMLARNIYTWNLFIMKTVFFFFFWKYDWSLDHSLCVCVFVCLFACFYVSWRSRNNLRKFPLMSRSKQVKRGSFSEKCITFSFSSHKNLKLIWRSICITNLTSQFTAECLRIHPCYLFLFALLHTECEDHVLGSHCPKGAVDLSSRTSR